MSENKYYTQIAATHNVVCNQEGIRKLNILWEELKVQDMNFHFMVDYIPVTKEPKLYKVLFWGQDTNEISIPRRVWNLIAELMVEDNDANFLEFGVASILVNKEEKPVVEPSCAYGRRFRLTRDGNIVHPEMLYPDIES
jgi:hypothetical protein